MQSIRKRGDKSIRKKGENDIMLKLLDQSIGSLRIQFNCIASEEAENTKTKYYNSTFKSKGENCSIKRKLGRKILNQKGKYEKEAIVSDFFFYLKGVISDGERSGFLGLDFDPNDPLRRFAGLYMFTSA